jgi:hypothetical protein
MREELKADMMLITANTLPTSFSSTHLLTIALKQEIYLLLRHIDKYIA